MIHEVAAKKSSLLAIIVGNPDIKFHTVQKYPQKSGNNMLRCPNMVMVIMGSVPTATPCTGPGVVAPGVIGVNTGEIGVKAVDVSRIWTKLFASNVVKMAILQIGVPKAIWPF